MVMIEELHPVVREIVEQATEELDLFETVRLRQLMIEKIFEVSLCNMITPNMVNEICQQVLVEDIARLEREVVSVMLEEEKEQ